MIWFLVLQFFSMVLTLLRLGRTSDTDKDLEILILRQQLGILQRQQDKPIKPNRAEKLTLAVPRNSLQWLNSESSVDEAWMIPHFASMVPVAAGNGAAAPTAPRRDPTRARELVSELRAG